MSQLQSVPLVLSKENSNATQVSLFDLVWSFLFAGYIHKNNIYSSQLCFNFWFKISFFDKFPKNLKNARQIFFCSVSAHRKLIRASIEKKRSRTKLMRFI